jgi:hypothetical protein
MGVVYLDMSFERGGLMVSLSIGLKSGLQIHIRAIIGVFLRYELRMLKSRKVDTSDMRRGGDGL